MVKKKAVFLDRDGVLVKSIVRKGKGYAPTNLKNFRIYKDSFKCIKVLNSLGFKTIVVTNQPDVERKLISNKTLKKMHNLLKKKTKVTKIFFCPHTLEAKCKCRKPRTGMLNKASQMFNINFKKSYMVGDRSIDIDCGNKVGCKSIFIDRNYLEKKPLKQIVSVRNIKEATKFILRDIKNEQHS